MKLQALSLAASLATVAFGTIAHAQTARANYRDQRQEQRIQIGAIRGEITPMEYNRLMRQEQRIDMLQSNAARDGVVTPWEARQIERAQDLQSQRINRLRHNRRFR